MSDRNDHHGQTDSLAQLRDANPVPLDPAARAHPAAQALFEEITMGTTITDRTTPEDAAVERGVDDARTMSTGRQRRSRWTFAAAAAAIAVVATGVVAIWPRDGQTAQAAVLAAAESTEAAESGRIIGSIEIGDEERIDLDTRFDGEDVTTRFEVTGATAPVSEALVTEFRTVDGELFFASGQADGGLQWIVGGEDIFTDLDPILSVPGGTSIADADGLVDVISAAEGFEALGDGAYAATVTLDAIRSLESIPFGLALLAADDAVPGDLVLDLRTTIGDDGRLSRLSVEFDDPDAPAEAPFRSRIESSFIELDTPQSIEAPANAQPALTPADFDMPPEVDAAFELTATFFADNPDVCGDVIDRFSELETCLRTAGYDEVADAIIVIEEFAERNVNDVAGD